MLGYPNAANKIRAASGTASGTAVPTAAPTAKMANTKINNSDFDDDDTATVNANDNKDLRRRRRRQRRRSHSDKTDEPMPDEAGSRTQMSSAKSKSGFCYIGEDRGFRSCIKVSEGENCMSGDIFPTEAVCINPSLRP